MKIVLLRTVDSISCIVTLTQYCRYFVV